MFHNTFVVTNVSLQKFHQAAKRLKNEQSIPHHQALEQVAKNAGFNHWHHLVSTAKSTIESEQAINSGLVIAMDVKEAQDFYDSENRFIEDQRLYYLLENQFIELCKEFEDEDGVKYNQALSQEKLIEEAREFMTNLVLYRYIKPETPSSLEDALDIMRDCCFWQPVYIWLKGDFSELR